MERICTIRLVHCFTATPNARAARKSDGRKSASSRHSLASPCERPSSEDGGQTTATSNRKMLAPSQADDVPQLSQRESQGIVYWHKKWSVSVSIRSIHCFTATLNARAARKSDGRKRFPSRHSLASPCGRGGRAQRGRRGQITATSNRKMLAPSQADDVPRAQGPLSHLR